MTACKHNHLDRLEGPIHPSGKDYVCEDCGEQLKAEVSVPTVQFGTAAQSANNPTAILDGIETRQLRDENGREVKGALWVRRDDVSEALMQAAAQSGSGTAGDWQPCASEFCNRRRGKRCSSCHWNCSPARAVPVASQDESLREAVQNAVKAWNDWSHTRASLPSEAWLNAMGEMRAALTPADEGGKRT